MVSACFIMVQIQKKIHISFHLELKKILTAVLKGGLDISTPDISTTDNSTPDISTPDNSTPDNSTPDNSTPDISTPL